MNNQSQQIIPDSQSVIHFVEQKTISFLDDCTTLLIDELMEKLNSPSLPKLSLEKVRHIFVKARSVGS